MSGSVELHGMDFSVYVRIARLALIEKGVPYRLVPLNPFADDPPDPNKDLHPFGKMPVLRHGSTRIYETQAIVRHIDEGFPGPSLQPADPIERARQNQIMGICDSYLYEALVWGVFVETLRKPAEGGVTDRAVVEASLEIVRISLSEIETLVSENASASMSLADLYLFPMLDYGLRVEAAAALFSGLPLLTKYWRRMRNTNAVQATDPTDLTAALPRHTLT